MIVYKERDLVFEIELDSDSLPNFLPILSREGADPFKNAQFTYNRYFVKQLAKSQWSLLVAATPHCGIDG
jgi:hypothetical protein